MASLTFSIIPAGLAVPVWIGLAGPATLGLHAAAQPIPLPVRTEGLLDTCANVTAVASWVLQQFALTPFATSSTHTAAGLLGVDLYEVSLSITDPNHAGSPMLTLPTLVVMELTTILPDADVVIGLDVILECKLIVDGPGRQFTLEF